MSIRLGFSPASHTRISTNRRGNVRLGLGAHSGPWSITTGKTLAQGYRKNRNAKPGTAAHAQNVLTDKFIDQNNDQWLQYGAYQEQIRLQDAYVAAVRDRKVAEEKLALSIKIAKERLARG